MLADGELDALLARISRIPHVARVRLHTRLPIVVPTRVTAALIATLRRTRLTPIVVVDVYHPAAHAVWVAEARGRFI
jgi:L-lysine 2,3-aminomutase